MLHTDSTAIDRALREVYNITRTQDSDGRWIINIQFRDGGVAEVYAKKLLDTLWSVREHQLDTKQSYTD